MRNACHTLQDMTRVSYCCLLAASKANYTVLSLILAAVAPQVSELLCLALAEV